MTGEAGPDLKANKQVVQAFWDAFSAMRFDDALGLLAADATWWIAGATDISGDYSKQQFTELATGIAENSEAGIQVTLTNMTAEEDRVAAEAVSHGRMKSGKVYNNRYHLQHVLRGGRIVAVREYLDTQHVQEVFGNDPGAEGQAG